MSSETKAEGMGIFDVVKWLVAIALLAGAVAVNYVFADLGVLYRVLAIVALMLACTGVALTTVKGQEFMTLLKEANKERRRVVWPTPAETRQTTLIVVAVVFLVGIALWLLDMGLSSVVELIIG